MAHKLTIRGKKKTHTSTDDFGEIKHYFVFGSLKTQKTVGISIVSQIFVYLFIRLFTVGVKNSINSRLQNTPTK